MILAHAFGARYDLPIPLYDFVAGGAVVVVGSFAVAVRRDDRGDEPTADESTNGSTIHRLHPIAGTVSLLWLAFLIWCGYVGSQEVAENIIVTWFWLYVWIAIPLSVAILGDWTQPVNPYAYLAKLADSDRVRAVLLGSPRPVSWPDWLGWWPAVVLLFLGACGELIFNLTTTIPHVTADILLSYAALSTVMGLLFGREWLRKGEGFSVLYDTWGRLGYFRFGTPGARGFAGGLRRGFDRHASRIAFVMVMLLNVNFDGLLSTPQWASVLRDLPNGYNLPNNHQHLFNVVSFALMVATMSLILGMFATASARVGEHRSTPRDSLVGLLPSLIPIAFGYLLAHNLEYLLVNGQLMFPLIGDPPGGSINWPVHLPRPFNDSYEIHHAFLPSAFYWYTSLAVIVAVHVYAVVIAHRHLGSRGRTRQLRFRSELPWLGAMVGYTCLSLWLLAQPLTKETSTTSNAALASPPGTDRSATVRIVS